MCTNNWLLNDGTSFGLGRKGDTGVVAVERRLLVWGRARVVPRLQPIYTLNATTVYYYYYYCTNCHLSVSLVRGGTVGMQYVARSR